MATVKFDELALQYVLSDDPEQAKSVAEKAASAIEGTANNRVLIGQWVSSINRWMPSSSAGDFDDGEGQDDDFISRAKALEFLASTLTALERQTLKADQVQLLVNFFCSLFSSDHKAGITASAKALRELTTMKMFKPAIGNDIIEGVCKLGGDFRLQAPGTRLEIYQLILGLIRDPAVSNDLEYKHGNTCGFMMGLLELCRNERDPNNLMKWFETLKIFLQNFSPAPEVTTEVFKTFSAYFPISLRASATPSGIKADDLKGAVRSCFAAHHRLATHAIPFLVEKLDQGDAVTVAVKVDILQTLDACVSQYGHPQQSVVPFVDQIWSSLKYEVRNGEITDTIEATLRVITSMVKRLGDDDIRSFFNSTWRDIGDDISSPTYAAQAGRLLVSILGASARSFSLVAPALSHVQITLKTSKSASHQKDLLAVLNSILLVRSHLVAGYEDSQSLDDPLKDGLFGDTLFFDVYLPIWQSSSSHNITERVEILNKVMEGLAALVGQKSYQAEPQRLTSDATCTQIFNLLSEPTITCPLKGESVIDTAPGDPDEELRNSAASALKKAVPLYPPGFRLLLVQYITTVQSLYPTRSSSSEFVAEVKQSAVTLCDVACPVESKASLPLSDHILLINTLLNGLFWTLEQQAPPRYWSAFISSIHLALSRSLASMSEGSAQTDLKSQAISAELHAQLGGHYEQILQTKLYERSDSESMLQATKDITSNEHHQLLVYFYCLVKQLYRRFTDVYSSSGEGSDKRWNIGLHKDFLSDDQNLTTQQDICLHQVALLAASVVGALNEDEQKALRVDEEAFIFFRGDDQTADGTKVREQILVRSAEFSPLHEYRTAPLSMGILQGLFPGALGHERHVSALRHLTIILTSIPSPCSDVTRAALDTSWAILSNKFVVKGDERKAEWLSIQEEIVVAFERIWGSGDGNSSNSSKAGDKEHADTIRVFRSILHFLSGDVARFQGDPRMNALLRLVCERAPADPATGRQLAAHFGLLLSPKECLQRENHAVRKRLAEAWVYHQAVQPYLGRCFPGEGGGAEGEQEATSRAVAAFALLRHAKYEHYADDAALVVRVAIRSLGSSSGDLLRGGGAELVSCLAVLLDVLDRDPEVLREHLASLIGGMARVYEEAKTALASVGRRASALGARDVNSLNACRKLVLDFFRRLPSTYDSSPGLLVAHRRQLLRPLSTACGDPVREIRRLALAARQAWEDVA